MSVLFINIKSFILQYISINHSTIQLIDIFPYAFIINPVLSSVSFTRKYDRLAYWQLRFHVFTTLCRSGYQWLFTTNIFFGINFWFGERKITCKRDLQSKLSENYWRYSVCLDKNLPIPPGDASGPAWRRKKENRFKPLAASVQFSWRKHNLALNLTLSLMYACGQ